MTRSLNRSTRAPPTFSPSRSMQNLEGGQSRVARASAITGEDNLEWGPGFCRRKAVESLSRSFQLMMALPLTASLPCMARHCSKQSNFHSSLALASSFLVAPVVVYCAPAGGGHLSSALRLSSTLGVKCINPACCQLYRLLSALSPVVGFVACCWL